jgi:lysyl-tRNA synthetase class I
MKREKITIGKINENKAKGIKMARTALYDYPMAMLAEEAGMEGKAMFRAAYQALIGKDQGPRLASFLRSIHKERLLGILAKY